MPSPALSANGDVDSPLVVGAAHGGRTVDDELALTHCQRRLPGQVIAAPSGDARSKLGAASKDAEQLDRRTEHLKSSSGVRLERGLERATRGRPASVGIRGR